tara:strand:- start:201 stop:368 length:168 start_codon:yes stop_codon:yes gene_type:complete
MYSNINNNNQMSASNNSGPQLNALRDNYNKLISKKVVMGKSKKVQWESKRRFSSI